jgi:hypothetical protein
MNNWHGNCSLPMVCARLKAGSEVRLSTILVYGKETMKALAKPMDITQALESLRAHSFDVAPNAAVAGGTLVSKTGVGAVLVAGGDGAAAYAVHPGALVNGEVARLLDRGYQKFIKTSRYELPATAAQLEAIHAFSEELSQITGGISLYNEALGTTSDEYEYDRLKGR